MNHDGASASRSCHPSVQGQTRASGSGFRARKKAMLGVGLSGVPLPTSGRTTTLMRARRAPDQAPTCMGPWGWRGPGAGRGSARRPRPWSAPVTGRRERSHDLIAAVVTGRGADDVERQRQASIMARADDAELEGREQNRTSKDVMAGRSRGSSSD